MFALWYVTDGQRFSWDASSQLELLVGTSPGIQVGRMRATTSFSSGLLEFRRKKLKSFVLHNFGTALCTRCAVIAEKQNCRPWCIWWELTFADLVKCTTSSIVSSYLLLERRRITSTFGTSDTMTDVMLHATTMYVPLVHSQSLLWPVN